MTRRSLLWFYYLLRSPFFETFIARGYFCIVLSLYLIIFEQEKCRERERVAHVRKCTIDWKRPRCAFSSFYTFEILSNDIY